MQNNHPIVQLKEANSKLQFTIKNIPTIKSAMHWMLKLESFCERINYGINPIEI